jgi:N-methylhydantoinase B
MISIVDEAAAALVRTSFSTIVRESNDFACVLTTADGRSIAQATNSIPSFMNTMPQTIRHFLREFPLETLEDGDILITNDIWQGTGHLPDISVAKPIFLNGQGVAWSGSVAHAPDIGGRIRSADARVVYEVGLRIPIM